MVSTPLAESAEHAARRHPDVRWIFRPPNFGQQRCACHLDQGTPMSSHKQDSPNNSQSLEPLFQSYREFMTKLAETWDRPVQMHNREAFCVWWEMLDAKTRTRWETDLHRGYDQVVSDARANVAEVIRKHKAPVG